MELNILDESPHHHEIYPIYDTDMYIVNILVMFQDLKSLMSCLAIVSSWMLDVPS